MNQPSFFTGLAGETAICAYCGYCRTVCPTYAGVGWESCSPRGRIQLTKMLTSGAKSDAALTPEHLTRLFQCTLCGHCTEVCSTRIDLRQYWLAARTAATERGLAPAGPAAARDNALKTGNVYGYQNDERAGWADYMDDAPADLFRRDQAEVVYFVGCSSSFSPRAQRMAESFARLMTTANVDFTILAEEEQCCGFPLQAAGLGDQCRELIERNVAAVKTTGAGTVVFTCPACRLMWREAYAPLLPGVRLLHATEMLADLAKEGRLPLDVAERTVTYHDPCDLGRNGGIYDAPRRALAAVPGLRLVEAHDRREHGLCCGGGGDLEMVDPGLAATVAERTVGKLAATGAQAIVTACPQCLRTLSKAVQDHGLDVEVVDITELLARTMG